MNLCVFFLVTGGTRRYLKMIGKKIFSKNIRDLKLTLVNLTRTPHPDMLDK